MQGIECLTPHLEVDGSNLNGHCGTNSEHRLGDGSCIKLPMKRHGQQLSVISMKPVHSQSGDSRVQKIVGPVISTQALQFEIYEY